MTLTIDLTPQEEKQLSVLASMEGLDLGTLARRFVTERLPTFGKVGAGDPDDVAVPYAVDPNHFYFTATSEEFNRALDEIAEMNRDLPVLPPEAFSRESIYEGY
jgi:hypothetical protein